MSLGNEAWPIPTYTNPISGVLLLDDNLMLIPEERANILMSILVAHYDKEKTTYTDGVTASVANRTEKRLFQTMAGKEMKCTVQRNGNDFVFSLEGNGVFFQEASDNDADEQETEEKYDENAKLVGKMMKLSAPGYSQDTSQRQAGRCRLPFFHSTAGGKGSFGTADYGKSQSG